MSSARMDAALEAYAEALAAETHYRLPAEPVEVDSLGEPGTTVTRYVGRCACGWPSRPKGRRAVANRSAGLHVTLAGKRVERAAKAAFEAKLAELDAQARP